MTSILAVHTRERCISTCDYRCYYAMQPSELKEVRRDACICICGGKNHGLGRAHAIKNHANGVGMSRADLEAYAATHGLDPNDLVVIDRLKVTNKRRAAELAKRLLDPPPLERGEDLFACEEVL